LEKKATENSRNFIENKHKSVLKQFNTQILNLNEQFKILNNDGKGKKYNIGGLKYKINIGRNETKLFLVEINKLKTKLDFVLNLSKERVIKYFY